MQIRLAGSAFRETVPCGEMAAGFVQRDRAPMRFERDPAAKPCMLERANCAGKSICPVPTSTQLRAALVPSREASLMWT
jgi:hypothetical protein